MMLSLDRLIADKFRFRLSWTQARYNPSGPVRFHFFHLKIQQNTIFHSTGHGLSPIATGFLGFWEWFLSLFKFFLLKTPSFSDFFSQSRANKKANNWKRGRPEALDARDRRAIARYTLKNPFASVAAITAGTKVAASPSTVRRILRRMEFSCLKRRTPYGRRTRCSSQTTRRSTSPRNPSPGWKVQGSTSSGGLHNLLTFLPLRIYGLSCPSYNSKSELWNAVVRKWNSVAYMVAHYSTMHQRVVIVLEINGEKIKH